jgi:hypothetical protein
MFVLLLVYDILMKICEIINNALEFPFKIVLESVYNDFVQKYSLYIKSHAHI